MNGGRKNQKYLTNQGRASAFLIGTLENEGGNQVSFLPASAQAALPCWGEEVTDGGVWICTKMVLSPDVSNLKPITSAYNFPLGNMKLFEKWVVVMIAQLYTFTKSPDLLGVECMVCKSYFNEVV